MSENENEETSKPFCIERAKQGRAKCKKCKLNCEARELRLAKLVFNPFGDGLMKQWYHVNCLFEQFLNQRATTKRIEDSDDIDGWDELSDDDKNEINKLIEKTGKVFASRSGTKNSPKEKKTPSPKKDKDDSGQQPNKKKTDSEQKPSKKKDDSEQKPSRKKDDSEQKQSKKKDDSEQKPSSNTSVANNANHKDNLFREFRRLVAEVTNENSYLEKSAIMSDMFKKGTDGTSFKGDLLLWIRLLLPGVIKRIYNLQSKQLVKLFSVLFGTDREEMLEHLEQGDVGETIQHFFENSNTTRPCKKSLLSLLEVDEFLEELSALTKEEEQIHHFKKILKKCTANDLKIIIRLIKHDLRMNAGAKPVLDAVHPDAYSSFQSSRDLSLVLKKVSVQDRKASSSKNSDSKASIEVMTPVLPMLAEACKSVEQAMKKCPNGMFSEIKYDGERVQVHKSGTGFKYFSRSLKPVLPHKVNHFKNYIPDAFPYAKDLILDSEVLLVDTLTGKPLPFGSLGVHKKEEFKDASVCLFVFDCIYYNGESLMRKPMKERRRILEENMIEIKNHVMFSETETINKPKDLAVMIGKVLNLGLEGLVLKDLMGIYEPGKRHWLKVKKDYLLDGAMADSADLVVLGAWYGTGKKGGMMSVFLMGCYDEYTQKFCTVTKVHTGHDDKTLEQLQTELDMIKISCDMSKIPDWLKCTKTMVPDFVARDPKKQPVWEITGAEFTQHEVHTADGISIRFPRVTKIRSDKSWDTATNLEELKTLFKTSKESTDYTSLIKTEYESDTLDEKEEIKSEDKPSTSKAITSYFEVQSKNSSKRRSSDSSEHEKHSSKKLKTEEFICRYPDLFTNVKIWPTNDVRENHEAILRYFIACDGTVLNEDECESATHIIHSEEFVDEEEVRKYSSFSSRHITVDWIKDSIGNNEIQDTRPYTVHWKI